jgi:hypothetical protein
VTTLMRFILKLHTEEFVVFNLVFSFVESSLTRAEGSLGFRRV